MSLKVNLRFWGDQYSGTPIENILVRGHIHQQLVHIIASIYSNPIHYQNPAGSLECTLEALITALNLDLVSIHLLVIAV